MTDQVFVLKSNHSNGRNFLNEHLNIQYYVKFWQLYENDEAGSSRFNTWE